jgi:hypothetical protein
MAITAGVGADLTLDEYAARTSTIERAATEGEVEAALVGLPEDQGEARRVDHGRWLVGLFGGSEQRGRWRLSSRLRIIALLGGVRLDLGNAQPEAAESVITVLAFLGGVDLIAPPGLPIELSGISLVGGKSDKRPSAPRLPGAPLLRVRALAVLGAVGIKHSKPPRRKLSDVIRGPRNEPSPIKRQAPPGSQSSPAARE